MIVKCPLCAFAFETKESDKEYKLSGSEAVYHQTECPHCGEILLYSKIHPYGLIKKMIPEEELTEL